MARPRIAKVELTPPAKKTYRIKFYDSMNQKQIIFQNVWQIQHFG